MKALSKKLSRSKIQVALPANTPPLASPGLGFCETKQMADNSGLLTESIRIPHKASSRNSSVSSEVTVRLEDSNNEVLSTDCAAKSPKRIHELSQDLDEVRVLVEMVSRRRQVDSRYIFADIPRALRDVLGLHQ